MERAPPPLFFDYYMTTQTPQILKRATELITQLYEYTDPDKTADDFYVDYTNDYCCISFLGPGWDMVISVDLEKNGTLFEATLIPCVQDEELGSAAEETSIVENLSELPESFLSFLREL